MKKLWFQSFNAFRVSRKETEAVSRKEVLFGLLSGGRGAFNSLASS
jgi:hypothetical protein